MSVHYVDNKELFAELVDYKKERLVAKEKGEDVPRVSNAVGTCILQIANGLAMKPCFRDYQFIDDMVSDGVENCINYIANFDPDKYNNPFAYFTQVIYFAFLRRIEKEKRQLYIKHKTLENSMLLDELVEHGDSDDTFSGSGFQSLTSDYMQDFVENYERKALEKKERRAKKQNKALDKFYDNEEGDKVDEQAPEE